MSAYAIVLRSCEAASLNTVTGLLGRAFSLKEATCSNILQSCPIVLVDGLTEEEAAACSLCLRTLEVAGAQLNYIPQDSEDLPKIDWPKKPSIFKQSLPALVRAYDWGLNAGGSEFKLIDLLKARLTGAAADGYAPAPSAGTQQAQQTTASGRLTNVAEFTGANLPEVTPFSNVALSDPAASPTPAAASKTFEESGSNEIGDRMNELFGMDDDDELVPSSNEVTNILDKILPDEEPGTGTITGLGAGPRTSAPATGPIPNGAEVSGSNQILPSGTGNFSLFLSKIPDAARREKAVPLIAELAKIEKEEAEKLAKKVIIPVLKAVAKEEAEAAKHRFAEIGILARIKNS